MKPDSVKCRQRMIRVAKGEEKADLVIKRAKYLNVFTEAWEYGDIAIAEGRIAGIGDYAGLAEYAGDGLIVVPGLIDGHIHLESSLLSPAVFAGSVISHGTTAVVCDPHEIANVMGADGIRYMLEATEGLPLDVFVMLPSCVPATGEDESFAVLSAADLEPFYAHPRVLGLAEMMNYPGVLSGDEAVAEKLVSALNAGLPIDGHAPFLSGKKLQAYVAAGIASDHECTIYSEGLEKLRNGQWLMLRQGTAAKNLLALLPLLKQPYASRCLFVTDDKHPADLRHEGHIDGLVRLAVENGAELITALKAATWNAAQAFRLFGRGAVAPGYVADLAILDETLTVCTTIKDGTVVYNGHTAPVSKPAIAAELLSLARQSFHMSPVCAEQFRHEGSLGVIKMINGQIVTEDGGMADHIDTEKDILKIAVLERHHSTGHVGVGYLLGYGLKQGAIATSVAHDSHNLIVVGTNERDMACAAERVRQLGGGIVIADQNQIMGELPLPIAGLMSDQDADSVNAKLEALKETAARMGVADGVDPFMTLSFMSLPVIPAMRILTYGVFDVAHWKYR